MQGRILFGNHAESPRRFAFAARDRIDETVQRMRSVHEAHYHYIRTFTNGPTFASLNRYKEKCFPILPLMRDLQAKGKLTGAPLALMQRTGPCEELYNTDTDPHEIHNLLESNNKEDQLALTRLRAALDTWIVETGDRGAIPEPEGIVAPFEKEMDAWFGTPTWYKP